MLRKLLSTIGFGSASAVPPIGPPYSPYADSAANDIYNLLFCDEPARYQPTQGQSPIGWQTTLFAETPDPTALLALATDRSEEGRVRYVAFSRLRAMGNEVPPKALLAVIVEVPLSEGLDVLAAFSEGGVRYINQTGKLAVFESLPALEPYVGNLFSASEPVVTQIGPWDQPRKSPPNAGNIRLTFLVSDDLYFGEGPTSAMQREAMAGPIIQRATELLQVVVNMATK